jgi:hypothetical protein
MEATSNRVDATRAIGEALSIYRDQFGALIGAGVIVLGIAGALNGLASESDSALIQLAGSIISLVGSAIYIGFVVKLVQDVRDGRRDNTVGDLIRSATPYIGTLILIGILFGVGVFIGLVLLIIPGLFLLTIWSVSSPAAVVENTGVIGAFGRSRELVKGEGWSVFGALILTLILVIAVNLVLALVGAGIGGAAGAVVLSVIGSILVTPIYALVVSELFFDLGGGSGAPAAPVTDVQPPAAPPPAA